MLQYEIINLKMNHDQNNKDNNKENDKEIDCKPTVQEKKQADEKKKADEEDSDYTTDTDMPLRKRRIRRSKKRRTKLECSKTRFSLGCEVFHKDLMFNENDEPAHIDSFKLKDMAQEAHQRMMELDVIRSGNKQIKDAYKDLY